MGYIFLLLISMLVIMFLPQLLYFILIFWVVTSIFKVLFPKRPRNNRNQQDRGTRGNTTSSDQNYKTNQSSSSNKDVIDVEYTEHEVDED